MEDKNTADEQFMMEAIAEAQLAASKGEVPIGAVAVISKAIVGRGHNMRELSKDPLGHAEILLISQLSKQLGRWRLDDVSIYVTCEPCIMCAGAVLQARIKRCVFGCFDPKAGAMGSLYNLAIDERLNHRIEVSGGVMASECGRLLSDFFAGLRKR